MSVVPIRWLQSGAGWCTPSPLLTWRPGPLAVVLEVAGLHFLRQEWGLGVAGLPWGPGIQKAFCASVFPSLPESVILPMLPSEATISWPSLHLFANSGFFSLQQLKSGLNTSALWCLASPTLFFLPWQWWSCKPFLTSLCIPCKLLCCVTVLFRVVSKACEFIFRMGVIHTAGTQGQGRESFSPSLTVRGRWSDLNSNDSTENRIISDHK